MILSQSFDHISEFKQELGSCPSLTQNILSYTYGIDLKQNTLINVFWIHKFGTRCFDQMNRIYTGGGNTSFNESIGISDLEPLPIDDVIAAVTLLLAWIWHCWSKQVECPSIVWGGGVAQSCPISYIRHTLPLWAPQLALKGPYDERQRYRWQYRSEAETWI